jgi:alpha-galactosidase
MRLGRGVEPDCRGLRRPVLHQVLVNAFGRLLPAPNRFPSAVDGAGFKPLADAVHALGLKFGIHIMRGIPRNSVQANLPIEGSTFTAAEAGNTNDKCVWCPDMFGVRQQCRRPGMV